MFATLALLAALAGAQPVHEEGYVRIGGIEQWITIHGDDRRNPVVLFLHGGPGDAYSPFADALFAGWDRGLTIVQWDQRGAGRTYARNGRSVEPTMTMDRMVGDGLEVAEYLTRHLGRRKIILVGGSWGSLLGMEMIHARPELFDRYVGVAQLVGWRENARASYARLLELARAAGDAAAVETLTDLGPPPWDSIRKWPRFHKLEMAYQAKRATAAQPALTRSAAYDSAEERKQDEEADDFSFIHFIGMTMSGPLVGVDLTALGTDFAVPITFVQGQEDIVAVPSLARAYFDRIRAPRKAFRLVPGTGHEPSVEAWAIVRDAVSR